MVDIQSDIMFFNARWNIFIVSIDGKFSAFMLQKSENLCLQFEEYLVCSGEFIFISVLKVLQGGHREKLVQ